MKNTRITFYECPELLSIEALEIIFVRIVYIFVEITIERPNCVHLR